jgi:hypothetical protein
VSIVVGLWAAEDTEKWSADLQSAMGAECYATSLQEIVAACRRVETTRTQTEEELPLVVNS